MTPYSGVLDAGMILRGLESMRDASFEEKRNFIVAQFVEYDASKKRHENAERMCMPFWQRVTGPGWWGRLWEHERLAIAFICGLAFGLAV